MSNQAIYYAITDNNGLTWGPTRIMAKAEDNLPLWGPVLYSQVRQCESAHHLEHQAHVSSAPVNSASRREGCMLLYILYVPIIKWPQCTHVGVNLSMACVGMCTEWHHAFVVLKVPPAMSVAE